MINFLQNSFLICFLVLVGCVSVEKLPKEYWLASASENSKTALVYVAEHQSKLSVETSIVSINGYTLESSNSLKVPIGRNKFRITCVGSTETRTSEIEYRIRGNRRHIIKGFDNGEGSCFTTITYI